MRHLSVPRDQTQVWLERCKANGWLEKTGVVPYNETHRAVPLTGEAPGQNDAFWEGHAIVDIEPKDPSPKHWTERLPAELQSKPASFWPSAFETQGDVLLVKLEPEVRPHGKAMAVAMLNHMPNIRVVCADNGVDGDFRVRSLEPLSSRDGTIHTTTTVREHGFEIQVDPGEVYFSARLSNQRQQTLERLQAFKQRLGHPIVLADPYAGVGPALPLLLAEPDLIEGFLVGDLNPKAVELLKTNVDRWVERAGGLFTPSTVVCEDARLWSNDERLSGRAHAVLVNLPHDSFEHLPAMFSLFCQEGESLLRGWTIVERDELPRQKERLERLVREAGGEPLETEISEVKGFSTTRCFAVFQTLFKWQ